MLRQIIQSCGKLSRILIAVAIATNVAWFGSELLAIETQAKEECRGQELSQAVFNDNLDRALAVAEHCIATCKAELEKAEREHDPKNPGFVDLVGLSEVGLGAFFVAKPEILTLKGSF